MPRTSVLASSKDDFASPGINASNFKIVTFCGLRPTGNKRRERESEESSQDMLRNAKEFNKILSN